MNGTICAHSIYVILDWSICNEFPAFVTQTYLALQFYFKLEIIMLQYIIASFALFSSASDDFNGTVWELINGTGSLSTLAGAINTTTDLVSILNDTSQNFTILAPNSFGYINI